MTEIKKILDEFVKECSENLELESIIQFGSSTYSEDFEDVDLMLVSKQKIISTDQRIELIKIIKSFESKYREVVFDFGGLGERNRSAEYSITVVYFNKEHLKLKHNPHDLFFFKLLSEDNRTKLLFGRDILKEVKLDLTNQHLYEMLSIDLVRDIMRNSLDDKDKLNKGLYSAFKSFLRAMLLHKGHFDKKDLLKEFEKEYGNVIELPRNSEKIIKKEISDEDFEGIMRFSENCLNHLTK